MPPVKLTDDQIRTYISAFRRIDLDKNGFITRDELFSLLDQVDLPQDPEQLSDVLKHLDMEKDSIDKTEVLKLCKYLLSKKLQPRQTGSLNALGASNFMISAANITTKVANWIAPDASDGNEASFFSNTMTRRNGALVPGSKNQIAAQSTISSQVKSTAEVPEVVVEIDGSQETLDDSEYEYYSYSDASDDESSVGPLTENFKTPVVQRRRPSASQDSAVDSADHAKKPQGDRRKSTTTNDKDRRTSIAPSDSAVSQQERAAKAEKERRRREKDRQQSEVRARGRTKNMKSVANLAGGTQSKKQGQLQSGGQRAGMATGRDRAVSVSGRPGNQKALMDPKIRKQLAQIKVHRPYFLQLCTLVHILVLCYEIYFNKGVAQLTENPFGGPSSLSLIQLGAKYSPCMRADPLVTRDFYQKCSFGYPASMPKAQNGSCLYYDNLDYICGLGGFTSREKPDQSFRFITPIFLHTGLLHLAFNLIIQTRTGFQMESQLGSIRMAIIYMISGFGGNVFAAILNPTSITVGASGALYGLFALLYLDLLQNWPLLINPWRDLTVLSLAVSFALCIGLLPFVDNYAHIGGFICGLLAGLIFMPRISFSKWDRRRKLILAVLSLPALIVMLAVLVDLFYTAPTFKCEWCIWLDCVPPSASWCRATT